MRRERARWEPVDHAIYSYDKSRRKAFFSLVTPTLRCGYYDIDRLKGLTLSTLIFSTSSSEVSDIPQEYSVLVKCRYLLVMILERFSNPSDKDTETCSSWHRQLILRPRECCCDLPTLTILGMIIENDFGTDYHLSM